MQASSWVKLAIIGVVVLCLAAYEPARPLLVILGVAGVVLLIAHEVGQRQKRTEIEKQHAFEQVVLLMAKGEVSLTDMQRIVGQRHKLGITRGQILGLAKQVGESVKLALTSKKRDIAESRLGFARQCVIEISDVHAGLLSPETMSEIRRMMDETEMEFHTVLYLNLSAASVAKSETLKTDKGRHKHLQAALDVIDEGLAVGKGDAERLLSARHLIEQKMGGTQSA